MVAASVVMSQRGPRAVVSGGVGVPSSQAPEALCQR